MGLPIIGNLFQLSLNAWIPFTQWKYKYGPLVYITAGNQGILILSSHQAAAELLDRRAHIYNSRSRFIVASDYLTGGMSLALLENNDVWKRMRRVVDEVLNKTLAPSLYPAQEEEAVRLVWNMLQSAGYKQWDSEIQRAAGSLILSMIYNLPTLQSSNDPTINRINQFTSRFTQAIYPGTYFVEFFPWMRFFPAFVSKWKRDAQMWYRRDTAFFRSLYDGVKDRMDKGDDRGCFTSHVMNRVRDQKGFDLSETEIAWLSATLYGGGVDTSATLVTWFVLAMLAHPEVQDKCQQELDTVVGRQRMPKFSDLEDLPYIRATAREVLRWRTPAPIGVPHRSTEDDWYGGYYIPKGTLVISNIWAMNRDKDVYGVDADEFKPERHLGSDGKLKPSPPDTKQGMFLLEYGLSLLATGAGRSRVQFVLHSRVYLSLVFERTCPGRHIANSFLLINIANILWAANISPEKDAKGNEVSPDISDTATVNDGIIAKPLPFKCSITPRFPGVIEVVNGIKQVFEK
ncbi:hypothetical protein PM082_004829 [Marasmius tenuissimus]|nr:hypothetical protein PM082_004829 [Marasmius tenuissimus]